MQSRAAVFHAPEQPLEVKTFPVAGASPDEILVQILCCTLCGSDLHTIRGERAVSGPTILGHEVVGRLVEVPSTFAAIPGFADSRLSVGDRVTWSITASCDACFYCRSGLAQKCERLFKYGHEAVTGSRALSGGLAEFCHLVPGTAVFKIPDKLSDIVACPANCATATVAAALRTAAGCRGKAVVIHGAGALGLTAAAMADQQGASNVLVTDLVAARRALAMRFGATHALPAQETTEIRNVVARSTDERGADVVLDMSGSPDAIERSIDLLRIGGQLILVGSVFPSRPISVYPERLVRGLLRVDGVHNYRAEDLATALRFLEQHCEAYPFDELVGGEYRLSEVNEAVSRALDGDVPRVAIRPGNRE